MGVIVKLMRMCDPYDTANRVSNQTLENGDAVFLVMNFLTK